MVLNVKRRQLQPAERQGMVSTLIERGWSLRRIAEALRISHMTVYRDSQAVTNVTPERVEGKDGKSYPAKQPEPEVAREDIGKWDIIQKLLPGFATHEWSGLLDSIERWGYSPSEPVWVLADGRIIDGYHGWKATNGQAPYIVVDVSEEKGFVLALRANLAKRHWSIEQIKELDRKWRRKTGESIFNFPARGRNETVREFRMMPTYSYSAEE